MTGRWLPLRGSLLMAAGFIGLRVLYRLLFGGVSWPVSWPALGLAAWAAVQLALPFALIIVACGLLSSLLDARRFLVALTGARIGRSVLTALAIGFAAVPALASSVVRLRRAQLLRGSHRRMALVVPLLESAVERAIALAAALDVRGFAARRQLSGDGSGAASFAEVSVAYGEHEVLRAVTLDCEPGSVTVLTGPTGGGKTTLLETLVGLAEHFNGATIAGQVRLAGLDRARVLPRETASLVGWVPQQVRLGFVGATVGDELAFALRLHSAACSSLRNSGTSGVPVTDETTSVTAATVVASAPELRARVQRTAAEFGLDGMLAQGVETLSAGQATRLALAAALIHQPQFLLLDEPLANLDAASAAALVELLTRLVRERGLTVLIAEHHTTALEALQPRWLSVVDGRVTHGRWLPSAELPARIPPILGVGEAVRLCWPSFSYCGQPRQLEAELSLHLGEIVALLGPNGAGKTSLLNALAAPGRPGEVCVRGVDAAGDRPEPGRIALVPEDARELFLCDSLREEFALADRLSGAAPGLTELSFRSVLGRDELPGSLLDTHPRDLSTGTQRALAVAIQLSHKPALLLIDEPTRGLDPGARAEMAEVLRCVAETGCAVLFASHDLPWAANLTNRSLQLVDGRVLPGNHSERSGADSASLGRASSTAPAFDGQAASTPATKRATR